MTVSVAGLPNEQLGSTGKKFVDDFKAANGAEPDPYSVYAAQAAEVMVGAIERSDGSRASIASELFNTDVTGRHPRLVQDRQERRHDVEPGHDLPDQERQVDDEHRRHPGPRPGQEDLSGPLA